MPLPYPHDQPAWKTVSFQEFKDISQGLLGDTLDDFSDDEEELHDPSRTAFARFVLTGRFEVDEGMAAEYGDWNVTDDQAEAPNPYESDAHRLKRTRCRRVRLNARAGASCTADDFEVWRDYDSVVGITNSLPYVEPIHIYTVPDFKRTIKKGIHQTITIIRDNGVST